ncbi:MAG: hypothetical protein IT210_13600 [Armatimonadetes bacterium]|nr:hypothetical protein [Armatimonadota bacterium]
MLCPFCLDDVTFRQVEAAGVPIYVCPRCKEQTPALYSKGYRRYPPVVVSAVGFRQHGKTVYFASLFYVLKQLALDQLWPEFFTMGLNEESLDTVQKNVAMLQGGQLPASTPKNFPQPTMIRLQGIPFEPDCTLLCYDTGGECFERPSQLVQYGGFVKRARLAMLLVSISDLEDAPREMHKLLNTYIVGMEELEATSQDQHLVVVFTKVDEITSRLLDGWSDLRDYMMAGDIESLAHPGGYLKRMRFISDRLRDFTGVELRAFEFLNAAEASFRSVEFCMVSSLGARPQDGRLPVQIVPRRVVDPLLWMIEKSVPPWFRWLKWLFP